MLVGGARLNAVLSSGEPPLAGGRQSSSTLKAKSTPVRVLFGLIMCSVICCWLSALQPFLFQDQVVTCDPFQQHLLIEVEAAAVERMRPTHVGTAGTE